MIESSFLDQVTKIAAIAAFVLSLASFCHSQHIARVETQAWLAIESAKLAFTAQWPQIRLELKNTGRTPATDIAATVTPTFGLNMERIDGVEVSKEDGLFLAGQSTVFYPIALDQNPIPDKFSANVKADTRKSPRTFVVSGIISYVTKYNKTEKLPFRFCAEFPIGTEISENLELDLHTDCAALANESTKARK